MYFLFCSTPHPTLSRGGTMNWSVKIWTEKRLTPLLTSPSGRNDELVNPSRGKVNPSPSLSLGEEWCLGLLLSLWSWICVALQNIPSPSGRNDVWEYLRIWIIWQLSKDGTNIPSPREGGRGEGYSELSLWVDEQNQIWNKLDLFGILRSAQNDGFKLKFLRMMRVIKNRPLS